MRRLVLIAFIAGTAVAVALAGDTATNNPQIEQEGNIWENLKVVIERNLGRPYVWGGIGLKSFDCSGFVWRVMYENNIFIKRTTARKLYLCLPKVSGDDRWNFATIVFFDDLQHCGIVNDFSTFYHAQSMAGTIVSKFDPYWRSRIYGFRGIPILQDESSQLPKQ